MSALAQPGPSRRPRSGDAAGSEEAARRRASLQPVPAAVPPLRQLPFVLVLAAVLGAGMVGLLVLNTTLQGQSFELRDKQQQATSLSYIEAGLQAQVDDLAATRSLVARATALGMRPNPAPAFLVLPDGTVVGTPKKADGTAFGSALVKSQAQLDAEKAAADARRRAAEEKKAAEEQKQAEEQQKKNDEKKNDDKNDDKNDEKKNETAGR